MTPKLAKSEQLYLQDKKNIKNIYVHKINSLMKLSRDNLLKQEMQFSTNPEKKKIKKAVSQLDKTTIKLQKNRESAKKARLRKKLYIKLLESQVQHLKKLQIQGQKLLNQSDQFIYNQQKVSETSAPRTQNQINLDKYICIQNEEQSIQESNNQFQQKLNQSNGMIKQICQLTTNTLLKKVCYIKNFQTLVPMLINKSEEQQAKMKTIVKKIGSQNQNMKNILLKLIAIEESAKQVCRSSRLRSQENIFQFQNLTAEKFLSKLNLNNQSNINMMEIQEKAKENYLNVQQSQKLAIRTQQFLQITNFKSEASQAYQI